MALQQPLLDLGDGRTTAGKGLWKLYLSHLLSTFGDRMWQFAVPVLFMTIWQDTLFPGALFNFVVNIITAFVFPYIGMWVDRTPRKTTMAVSIFGEASMMVCAAAFFLLMLYFMPDEEGGALKPPPSTPQIAACYAFIAFFSVATEACMQAGTVALEMDWPAILVPKEDDPDGRIKAELNSIMSSIDQSCKLLGPTAYGVVVQMLSGQSVRDQVIYGVGAIIVWNILCIPLEWFTISSLYEEHPALAARKEAKKKKQPTPFKDIVNGWGIWTKHPLCRPSFAASLLNLTVLSASAVTTAWMLWAGIPLGPLGFFRGLGAVMGVVGSWSYRWVYVCAGSPEVTATMGVCTFCVLIIPCAISMVMFGGTQQGAWTLLASITVSRFALFWFKPAWTQLVQERVSDDIRGAFTGVNKSLEKLFVSAIAALAMVFSNPTQFPILVYISNAAVTGAALTFAFWCWRYEEVHQVVPSG